MAPDVFVVRGVPVGQRRVFKVWEERRAPDWVLEVTSRSTRREDLVTKRDVYASLGVREYVLFDPLGQYLVPRLQAFRLVHGAYEAILPNAGGSFSSDVLGLEIHARGPELRFYDPRSREWLLSYEDALALAAEEHRRAEDVRRRAHDGNRCTEDERRRAETAEAELTRLRAELARLRGDAYAPAGRFFADCQSGASTKDFGDRA